MSRINPDSLGIKQVDSLHYYVYDLARSRRFFVEQLDFAEIGRSSVQMDEEGKQRSVVLKAGKVVIVLCEPVGKGGRAWRFLRKHTEGVGTVVFEVKDIQHTFALLEARGGTPTSDIQTFENEGGSLATFSITTPFGDTTFRFVERRGFHGLFPGMITYEEPRGGTNKFGFTHLDHITSNFQTMAPALLWMEHVLGLERYWDVAFHTQDVAGPREGGSGLRSVVMSDRASGIKFANNEPARPHFRSSQIYLFGEDFLGDGIQHVALSVRDIVSTVRTMRENKVPFMRTPGTYYDMLPARLEETTIGAIDEDIEVLRELEILVDGQAPGRYMLQVFCQDSAGIYNDPDAGPFFFELIQRKGDRGFGAGNFRALFESIEREQRAQGRL